MTELSLALAFPIGLSKLRYGSDTPFLPTLGEETITSRHSCHCSRFVSLMSLSFFFFNAIVS